LSKLKNYNTSALYFPGKLTHSMGLIKIFPCTVVEAPMGYGKTTFVREALKNSNAKILWQNVYESGNADFWHGFCGALSELNEAYAKSLSNIGLPGDYKLIREVLYLLQKLEILSETYLVIDDYHLVKSPEIDKFLDVFIRNLPKQLHLVIITRNSFLETTPLLRMKKLITLIGMQELQFSPEDISEYYRLMGVKISKQEQTLIYARSEGWVSALYLIMLDYIESGVFTTSRDMPELVRLVVYSRLSDELRAFLLHICIFDAFCPKQAQYMYQDNNCAKLLEELVKSNAFITWDKFTGEYHLHNIFSSCIREEFAQLPQERQTALWWRAGHWHMSIDEYVAAMDCFYKAKDFDNLLQAFEKDRSYATLGQYKEKMICYMTQCPPDIRARHHYAFIVYARLLFMVNEQALFGKTCAELLREINEDTLLDESERNTLLGEFQLVISFSKFNSISGMGDHFLLANNLLSKPSTLIDSVSNWTMGAPSILYMFYRKCGTLDKEIEVMNWGLPYYQELTGGNGLGAEKAFEAECCFMRGDFEQAEILLHRAITEAQETEQWSVILCIIFQQARILIIKGDYRAADTLLKNLRETLTYHNRFTLLYTIDICLAYIYALLGQPAKAPQWIAEGDFEGSKMLFIVVPFVHLVQSRMMVEQKQYLKLIGMSKLYSNMAGIFPYALCQIYLNIHLAAAYNGISRREEALDCLKKALDLSMPDRLFMPFVENGKHIGELLWNSGIFIEHETSIAEIRKLYESYQKFIDAIRAEYFEVPIAKLTEREAEVALLASRGLANREISRLLFISENTIKAHLKSAFSKLSIRSRAQLGIFFPENMAN